MKKILIIVFTILTFESYAQNMGSIYVQISPINSFIKVDGNVIEVSKEAIPFSLELEEGTHLIEIWAPNYEKISDTLTIEKNKRKKYFKKLVNYTDEFELYKRDLKLYKKLKSEKIISNICVPLANIGVLWYSLGLKKSKELSPLKEKTDFYRVQFANSIYQQSIDVNRIHFERYRKEYNQTRKQLYLRRSIGIPIVVIGGYFSYKFLKKLNKRKKERPLFTSDKNPFVLNDIDFSQNIEGYTFNLKFQF